MGLLIFTRMLSIEFPLYEFNEEFNFFSIRMGKSMSALLNVYPN